MSVETAVLSLHLQNAVIHPEGAVARRGNAEQVKERHVLQNVQRVFKYAREAGAAVIHVAGSTLRNHPGVMSSAPLFRAALSEGVFLRGTWSAAFHDDAAPAPGEAVLHHAGILSFPGTGLEALLQEYGVRKVLVFGVATRLVVEAAVFELTDRGYETFVVEDCCASGRADLHVQSIEILRAFATIVSSTETAGLFGAASA
jgi:nicotinamidase-related amidase